MIFHSLASHLRVVKTLTIREQQTSNANYSGGYACALLEVCLTLGVLMVMKTFLRVFNPPNMPPVLFLLLGGIPWFTFHNTSSQVAGSVMHRRNYLLLPNVTPMDIIIAKALSLLCTYGSIFVVALIGCTYFESAGEPRFLAGAILIYLLAWVLGIGFGLALMALVRVFPPGLKLVSPIWRIGILTSGVYFTITTLPAADWHYLTWNPMLHVSELMRTYWFTTYQSPIASPAYVVECVCGVLFFGLLLERFVRRRVPL
jgi:capsular polysaccharide transport system permease protein